MYCKQVLFYLLPLSLFPPLYQSNKFLDCSGVSIPCRGNDFNISYPFRVPGMPEYCGHPKFEVSCIENSTLEISIAKKKYRVSSIHYDIQFIGVSNLEYVSTNSCPGRYSNTSLDFSLYDYSSNSINMTMFFNCLHISPHPNIKNIPCLSNISSIGYDSYYSLPNNNLPSVAPELYEKCSSVVLIPMYQNMEDLLVNGRLDFLGVLQDGFGLNWIVGNGWCTNCKDSGGICGNDLNAPNAPMCYCRDGTTTNTTCPGKSKKTIIIGAAVGVVGAAAILGFCLFLFLYNRRKRQRQASLSNLLSHSSSSKILSKKDPEFGKNSYNTHIFTYDELQEATNNFSESRELGDGGFGTVYKGKLRDGRTVAVKRLYENNYRRLEQFKNEVDILSGLRHQNLVNLYGCTSGHSRELLLVYEYIPNGTLADHLHGTLASKELLPWPIRMSIAIETADALAYLHAVEPPIIHRDVKTNNILLDNDCHVKVADFGLSRLFPLDATHVSTAPQGTPGYVDPEYHQYYQLTDKSDVYSFGVVLVELISSKPAVDISRHRHEINLANMAVTKIQNCQIDQLVDSELGYQSDLEITRMINQVAELAFRCLQSDREMRPSIKEVLEVLRGIECGGKKAEKDHVEVSEVYTKEEMRLLKNVMPFSPDTVTEQWSSRLTTPNTSEGKKAEKDHVAVSEVYTKEETRLLKNAMPFSPDTVTEQWSSRSTTPNTSA